MIAGVTPKLIKSDKESSSIPKFELDLSNRAIFPSILSRKDAKITNDTEICHLFSIANLRAVRPKVNEMKVNKLGIKLLKDNFFIPVKKINYFNFAELKSAMMVSPEIEV
jgi:hypothetical protein